MSSTEIIVLAVRGALSAPRFATYEKAAGVKDDHDPAALELYAWNAKVSGALLAPLHFCEVVIRNAVADVLATIYGPRWPWSAGFEQSLPLSQRGYCQRKDLQDARRKATTAGQVIPELKFVFWQKLFTSRYDARLWNPYLFQFLPNIDQSKAVAVSRQSIYDDLEGIRRLRNRIAHHEPIFARNLAADFSVVVKLVEYRCLVSAAWLLANEQAQAAIQARP